MGRMTRREVGLGLGALAGAAAAGPRVAAAEPYAVTLSDAEWRRRLTPAAYAVLRRDGTERAYSSPLDTEKRAGTFACAGCEQPVFSSAAKYDSGTGWPSFREALPGGTGTSQDRSFGTVRDGRPLRTLRRASRPRLRRRPAADRQALVHERCCDAFPAGGHLIERRRSRATRHLRHGAATLDRGRMEDHRIRTLAMTRLTLKTLGLVAIAALAGLAPAQAAPKTTLVLGMGIEPTGLDPTIAAPVAIREITWANLFEGLVKLDRTGKVVPLLARSWQVSGDGLTYTFALQTGVKFHDGTPMTSADVKFAFDRARAPTSTNAQKQIFAPIEAIETPDPATVTIRLKQPSGNFLYYLAWGDASIRFAGERRDQPGDPDRHGPLQVQELGARRQGRARRQSRLLGRQAEARGGHLPVRDRRAGPRSPP